MKPADFSHRFVRWPDEDHLYIGFCPDLYIGGVCHGENEDQVYGDLCSIICDQVEHLQQWGEAMPTTIVRVTRDVEMVAG